MTMPLRIRARIGNLHSKDVREFTAMENAFQPSFLRCLDTKGKSYLINRLQIVAVQNDKGEWCHIKHTEHGMVEKLK